MRRNNISTLTFRCVPTKFSRIEDVAGDAAAAAPAQMHQEEQSMNSFASRKTEVFEKIDLALGQGKGVKVSTMMNSWSCAYSRMS